MVKLYAAKHNPFVYFQNVQEGTNPLLSYANMAGFDGGTGLWSDLGSGKVPDLLSLSPTSAITQHRARQCRAFIQLQIHISNGTKAGLNPALIILG